MAIEKQYVITIYNAISEFNTCYLVCLRLSSTQRIFFLSKVSGTFFPHVRQISTSLGIENFYLMLSGMKIYKWKFNLEVTLVKHSSVQLLSHVRLFVTPWTAACQVSLSITNSWSLLKLMSIESVMPANHLILRCPLLLLPSIFPSIRVFSDESVFRIRWPKYWSFSFSISPSNEYSGLISFRMDWL